MGGESWPVEQLWLFWVAPIIGALVGGVIYGFVGRPVGGAASEERTRRACLTSAAATPRAAAVHRDRRSAVRQDCEHETIRRGRGGSAPGSAGRAGGAAAYGCVLVLGGLTVLGVSDIALGQGAELIAGVGVATWIAHLFAEIVGDHVHRPQPLDRREVERAAVDGSPILASAVLPAIVLALGRFNLMTDATARIVAILVAIAQLLAIGSVRDQSGPGAAATARWVFAALVAGVGIAVVILTVLLGH